MAIAFDAAAELERTNTSDPATWTHTPVGRPMAIVVSAVHGTSSTDHVSTVTYGGVSMARIVRATDTSTEPGAAELWFLGVGIPTGAQTVSADLTSGTTDDIHFVSMSFTANCSTESIDFDSINENATNPSVTLNYAGRNAMAVAALYGGGAAPSSFTPNGNCTAVHDRDLGAFYSTVIRQTSAGTSDFAIGGTASVDDVAFVALALAESDDAPIIYPTGQSVTVGLGTPTVSPYADALVRVGSTSKVTAPLFTPIARPTGQAVTASLGTPAVTVSSTVVNPTGQVGTTGLGTPTVTGSGTDHQENPSGFGLTASQGTPVVEVVAFPSGQAGTAGLGTPAVTASSTVVNPTGQSATASQGTPLETVTALPAGQSATAGLGTPSEVVSSTVTPTGQAGTTALGTPSATGGSLVEVSGFGLTASLGTPAATSNAAAVSPTGYDLTMGLGTPTVGAVDGGAAAPPVQGEPIGTKWQRRPIRTPRPVQEPEPVRQDAMVAVSGFAVSARVGTTWQVADATIAPAGLQMYAQSNRAQATGMHNPTDAQIVDWLIQALNQSV